MSFFGRQHKMTHKGWRVVKPQHNQSVKNWFIGQVPNWVPWGQKLGHQAKSKQNLIKFLEVTILK